MYGTIPTLTRYVRNHKSHTNVDSRNFAAPLSATKIMQRRPPVIVKISPPTPYRSISTAVPKYYAPQ